MESANDKRIGENEDVNCRLRHGLNIYCLSYIFKYVNTGDLYTLGGMNEFYKQIIDDSVILGHTVDFCDLDGDEDAKLFEFFERHGTKIRKARNVKLGQINIHLLTHYGASENLRVVETLPGDDYAEMPIHFGGVERFTYVGLWGNRGPFLNVSFSESLRFLHFARVELHPHFNWMGLINLSELQLIDVTGINKPNLIEFIRQRPKIKKFHQRNSLYGSMKNIGKALAEYCGDQIEQFSDENSSSSDNSEIKRQFYEFISDFKNMKDVCLSTNYSCAGNLLFAIESLARHDTIERLVIHTSCLIDSIEDHNDCPLQRDTKMPIERFTKLKTIRIHASGWGLEHTKPCVRMKLLVQYMPEMLTSVETIEIMIGNRTYYWSFLKMIPNLQRVNIIPSRIYSIYADPGPKQALHIIESLKEIVRKRRTKQTPDDCIALHVFKPFYESFECNKIDNSIKLIKINKF